VLNTQRSCQRHVIGNSDVPLDDRPKFGMA
jgi:hypothetical protein